jgi:hypothetical protein
MIAPGPVESDRPDSQGDSNGKHGGMASGWEVWRQSRSPTRLVLDGADVL